MLESLNDYVSFIVLLAIIVGFLFLGLVRLFKNVERSRIKKAMLRRNQEQKGENI